MSENAVTFFLFDFSVTKVQKYTKNKEITLVYCYYLTIDKNYNTFWKTFKFCVSDNSVG